MAGAAGHLPFHFGRQMLAAPAGECVGLVIADVADRTCWIDRLHACQRHDMPFAVDLTPVARCLPLFVADARKAIHQPERRGRIAAVRHEGEPLGVGDEVARQADRADQGAVDRFLIVEMESLAGVSDAVDAFLDCNPFVGGTRGTREAPRRIVGGRNRVLRKGVKNVGQHQFLMLLLMVEADLDQRRDRGQLVVGSLVKELHGCRVDVTAIGRDFIGARPGQVAALVPGMAGAGGDIVGIEQEGIVGMEGLVSRTVFAEQELFEEPGGMGAVPFRRTCVRHRLDQLILGCQRAGTALGFISHRKKRIRQILSLAAGFGE